ncbi:MAG TPA: response regulator [Gammaproteobacteria bacterium]|nr:response regulator [Gammaproteobacteria bacterium]
MASVLVIDDQAISRQILDRIVRSIQPELEVFPFEGAEPALEWLKENTADLILSDYKMPGMNGIEFLEAVRGLPSAKDVPIVIVTSHEQKDVRYRALELGATDFITKPIDHTECRARFRNLLQLQQQRLIIENRANWLESRIDEATRAIREREKETLMRLAKAGEYRDEETGNHVVRMAKFSRVIAEALGLDEQRCSCIELAAPMHDIGKIGVPDQILLKPGRLTPAEFEIIKQHTLIGYEILKDSPSKYLNMGAEIALGHHEKFDGSGYPYGLAGHDIPLSARIVAVADVFDALGSVRYYKQAWEESRILQLLREERGRHFDPECVDAFFDRLEHIREIKHSLPDGKLREQLSTA